MKIAVVGLGAAGLRSMMLLEALGHEVIGFEARERLGGRMHTVRTEHGFYEAGGEWIGTSDTRIHALLREFGQSPGPRPQGAGMCHFQGKTWKYDELWEHIAPHFDEFLAKADELALDLDEPPWHNALYAQLDAQTFAEFLNKSVGDPLARAVIEAHYRSNEGDDAQWLGLLGWLAGYTLSVENGDAPGTASRFPNGAQAFCEAMAVRIAGPKRLSMPLRRVEQIGEQVHLYFDDHAEAFDRVVLAVPPPCLANILFDPELPEAFQDAIEADTRSRTMKIALHFRRRFWEEQGLSGALLSDLTVQETWDGTRGEGAVLLAYLNGDSADRTRALPDPVQAVVSSLAEVFPEATAEFSHGTIHDWATEYYSQGGFTTLGPDHVLSHWETWMHPLARLHFAGEHSARNYGFIEGALESAERVAEEIGKA